MAEGRRYLDDRGRDVIVAQAFGGRAWVAFREVNSPAMKGATWHRVKSALLPLRRCREAAERDLELYAGSKKGWVRVPTAEETRDLLLLVRSYEVPLEKIENWTHVERAQVCLWAGAVHLRASDNTHVRVPETPAIVAMLDSIKRVRREE